MVDLKGAVFSYLEERRDEMVRFLQRLVRVDTQVPPGLNYNRLCDILADRLSRYGYEVSVHEAPERYLKLSGGGVDGA
ncbi:hypothetical protein DRO42_00095 [Candidatus Bathyarchaeota archaeon]|nr:MAG: hypothetical protein DRO42_00095 [Candidatus Bathyarchaeota archaeon]